MSTAEPHMILPKTLPIFPLDEVLLLPGGQLPLNLFEPRYIDMFDEALRTDRLIGMIQTKGTGDDLYTVGCAGKITEFVETSDGRYEITLRGISRFTITKEIQTTNAFRTIAPDWTEFATDTASKHTCLGVDRENLKALLKIYFDRQEMECDWQAIDDAPDSKLMACLSMTCPFTAAEKQALLEEKCCKKRAKMFITMLEMELHS